MVLFGELFGFTDLLNIHTEKQSYYAGENVIGQIAFSVVQPIHVNGVYVNLHGREETKFTVQEQYNVRKGRETTVEYKTVTKRESNVFLKRSYCIFAQKCTMMPGNYVFPFNFRLESDIPASFDLPSDYGGSRKGKIEYRIIGEVAVPGTFNPNLRTVQELIIRETLRDDMNSIETYKEGKVTFLCCIPKGTVTLSANIDRNAYGPGEQIILSLLVDNTNSDVTLDALNLKVVRNIVLYAEGHRDSQCSTICKAVTPGLAAGDRTERQIFLRIPANTAPSAESDLVKCDYRLIVELKVPWSPDVTVKHPVQIYMPQRPDYVPTLIYPPNWSPTVYPSVDLNTLQYSSYDLKD